MSEAAMDVTGADLRGDYETDNIFAKILRGEAPAAKVFEDGEVFAFLDLFPQSRGHTLVVSKTSRARNLLDVEPRDLETLILGVQRVARALEAALKPDGLAVVQHNGMAAGQSIYHLHFHILPRWRDVPLTPHGQTGRADADALKAMAHTVAAEIS